MQTIAKYDEELLKNVKVPHRQFAPAAGDVTPGEAAEIAKVIDAYVKAYQTAELDDRVARVEQLSDAELMRIVRGGRTDDTVPVSRLLTAPR